MTTLALDLGQSVGWAAGDGTAAPTAGTFKLTPVLSEQDFGRALCCLADKTADMITRWRPSLVVAEAPMPIVMPNRPAGREIDAQLQFMLEAVVRMVAWRRDLQFRRAHLTSVNSVFLRGIPHESPDGKALKRDDRINLACVQRGWTMGDSHAKAAMAALAWAIERPEARAA